GPALDRRHAALEVDAHGPHAVDPAQRLLGAGGADAAADEPVHAQAHDVPIDRLDMGRRVREQASPDDLHVQSAPISLYGHAGARVRRNRPRTVGESAEAWRRLWLRVLSTGD